MSNIGWLLRYQPRIKPHRTKIIFPLSVRGCRAYVVMRTLLTINQDIINHWRSGKHDMRLRREYAGSKFTSLQISTVISIFLTAFSFTVTTT